VKLTTYLLGAASVWTGIFIATAVLLSCTPYFGQLLPILGGGAVWFIVLVPSATRRPHTPPMGANDAK
jgi:hypothetical protein